MSKELEQQARELPQLDNWVAEFSLTDEADVLDEFTLDQQAKIWGLMRTVWNTAQERIATRVQAEARLKEAKWWIVKAGDVMDAALENIPATHSIPWEECQKRLAALAQAAAPATKEG